jgi:hypothetical protein
MMENLANKVNYIRLILSISVVAILAALIIIPIRITSVLASCSDPPEVGVDWSYCDKQRANLTNANLMVSYLIYVNLALAIFTSHDFRSLLSLKLMLVCPIRIVSVFSGFLPEGLECLKHLVG